MRQDVSFFVRLIIICGLTISQLSMSFCEFRMIDEPWAQRKRLNVPSFKMFGSSLNVHLERDNLSTKLTKILNKTYDTVPQFV